MIWIAAILVFASMAWMWWEFKTAPLGDEDEDGYGPINWRED
jgi:hypothetical protein